MSKPRGFECLVCRADQHKHGAFLKYVRFLRVRMEKNVQNNEIIE